MGALYRLGQKFVDFCNVVQNNQNNSATVPSSAVVYQNLDKKVGLPNYESRVVKLGGSGNAMATGSYSFTATSDGYVNAYNMYSTYGAFYINFNVNNIQVADGQSPTSQVRCATIMFPVRKNDTVWVTLYNNALAEPMICFVPFK